MRLLPPKRLYVVVTDPRSEGKSTMMHRIPKRDRCEIRPGAWFVRSRRTTAGGLARKLRIGPKTMGLVMRAEFYAGYERDEVAETLDAWEGDGLHR